MAPNAASFTSSSLGFRCCADPQPAGATPTAPAAPADDDADEPGEPKSPPKDNFWTRMLAQADAAGNQAGLSAPGRESKDDRNGTGKARKDKRKR